MKKSQLRHLIREEIHLLEKKWRKDTYKKIRKLLKVPGNKKLTDHYKSAKNLARDLLNAVGDKKKATGMLSYVANLDPDDNIFDDALEAIKEM